MLGEQGAAPQQRQAHRRQTQRINGYQRSRGGGLRGAERTTFQQYRDDRIGEGQQHDGRRHQEQQGRQQTLADHRGVAVVVAVVPARGEPWKQHGQYRQRIERQRDGHDAEREGQHGDAAFVEKRGEHAFGEDARLLRARGQQYRGEGQAELAAVPLGSERRRVTQITDAAMLSQDQCQLRQQHADEDHHAGRLEQQDADDRTGIEQHGAGHRQYEDVVQVEQRTLAIEHRLHRHQQRPDAEHQLTAGDLCQWLAAMMMTLTTTPSAITRQ